MRVPAARGGRVRTGEARAVRRGGEVRGGCARRWKQGDDGSETRGVSQREYALRGERVVSGAGVPRARRPGGREPAVTDVLTATRRA